MSGLVSELLERQRGGLVAVREVSARADGVVKGVGLAKESRVARAKVKVVVQLADARGDLPDLPSLEPSLGQGIAVVLLELPEPSERLERLRTSEGEREGEIDLVSTFFLPGRSRVSKRPTETDARVSSAREMATDDGGDGDEVTSASGS